MSSASGFKSHGSNLVEKTERDVNRPPQNIEKAEARAMRKEEQALEDVAKARAANPALSADERIQAAAEAEMHKDAAHDLRHAKDASSRGHASNTMPGTTMGANTGMTAAGTRTL